MISPASAKILVVEDDPDIRDLIVLHLRREGLQPVSASDSIQAFRLLKEQSFQLAILDWMLPGVSGLEICRQINRSIPVLMVTARAEAVDIVQGLENGADDYLTKPFETAILIARVRALLRRSQLVSEPDTGILKAAGLRIDTRAHEVSCAGEPIQVTASEFRLLVGLIRNRGRVLSRDQLIHIVQGDGVTVIDRVIDTHVFGLRKKLGSCADVIETIRGVGYRIKAE